MRNREPSQEELLQRIRELELELSELRKETRTLRPGHVGDQRPADRAKECRWEVSPEGVYTHAEPGAWELFGCDPAEIVGRPLGCFMPPDEAGLFEKHFREHVQNLAALERIPTLLLTREGIPIAAESSGTPILDGAGFLVCYRGVHRLLPHPEELVRALLESEFPFRVLFENTLNGICVVEERTRRIRMANGTLCRMLGHDRDDLERMGVEDLHRPEDLPRVLGEFRRLVGGEIGLTRNIPVKRKDGSIFLADISAFPFRLGGLGWVIGIFLDVTERSRTEEALARSERLYRTTIDAMDDLAHLVGPDLKITLANRAFGQWCSRLGIQGDPIGRGVREVFPFLPEGVPEEYGRVFRQGQTLVTEETTVFPQGEVVTETRKIPVVENGRVVRVLTLVRDVTERKLHGREMEESEERFRVLFEGSLDAIFLMDPETGLILDVNPAGEELVQMPRERIVGMAHHRLYPPRARRAAVRAFRQFALGREEVDFVELPVLRADGTQAQVEILAQVLQIKGVPVVYGAFRDITRRREAEAALRRSEQKYRTLYENLRDASATVDMEGRILEFNSVFAELLGYAPEEIPGLDYRELTPTKWHAMEREIIETQVLKRGYSQVYEKEYVRKDGTVVPVELRTCLLRHEDGDPRGLWTIIRDISRRKRMETELMRVQTLDSLGTLAGGIAHDFNNLLAAILSSIAFVQRYGELAIEAKDALADAEKVTLRARSLSAQLLSFAKGGVPLKKTLSVAKLVRETAEFALSGSNVKCEYELPADLWMVDADPGQLGQVIQNLTLNADQAMPHGGILHIRARNLNLENNQVGQLAAGPYVEISLQDTGHGIPRTQLSRIFDLFYSTKGRGRGLGLATAFLAVSRHDGHIRAESEPGKGTCFHVTLPASGRLLPDVEENSGVQVKGSGRILLIDDEPIIRKSASRVLERLGYEVTPASDGREGLRLYEKAMEEDRPFGAVIADLTIPGGMGGRETISKLKAVDPHVRVIVSSGYSEDPIMSDPRRYGVRAVVAKPYRIEKLAETVLAVLLDRED